MHGLRAISGKRKALHLTAASLCAGAACAVADEARAYFEQAAAVSESPAQESYTPADFQEYQPLNALDIVKRIPGFAYDAGDKNVRGLSGAVGNVLIDGSRPSTKSVGLDDVLRRIPPRSISRIDVIRGGAPGVDMRGHAIVVNIVRVSGGSAFLGAELFTKAYADHKPAIGMRTEATRARGPWSLEGAAHWRRERDQANTGDGEIVRFGADSQIESAGRFQSHWDKKLFQANAAAEYRGEASLYRLGLGLNLDAQDRLEQADLVDASLQSFSERVVTDFRSDEGEITFDFEKRLSSGLTARILALQTIERDKTAATSTTGAGLYDSREEALSGETILRLAGSFTSSPRMTTEASLELAHNFLDKQTSLSLDQTPIDLPSANVLIKEQRGEASVSARWRASGMLIVEAALAGEVSRLTQSGDVEKSRSFQFIKPRASMTITPADAWQVRAVAERVAGQLNFDDYASSPSLETGDVSVGNPELTPETSWRFEAAIERTFWERGAVTVTLSHAEVSDVIDLVPIDNRFDAPGNIGDGVRDEISLALTAPLDRLGSPRTTVRFNGVWRMSEVIDPVSLTARRISKERPFTGDIQVTREFPSLKSSAGLEFFFGYSETSYRLSEIRIERATNDPLARLHWTWAPRPDLSMRLQLENFTFRDRSRERILFDGDRAGGAPVFREKRTAVMDPFIFARIRKTF